MTTEERPRSPDSNDDPATNAAREELRHTSISEKSEKSSTLPSTEPAEPADAAIESKEKKPTTSDLGHSDSHDEEMRERLGSPKKKRVRDQDDDGTALQDDAEQDKEAASSGNVTNGSRPLGQEPQKKRVRDGSEDRLSDTANADILETTTTTSPITAKLSKNVAASNTVSDEAKDLPQTSTSAFASSGFASMANSTTSPFGVVGASKPSVFGGSLTASTSGFGALAASKSPASGSTTSSSPFGALGSNKPSSGFGFGGSSTSGFGGLNSGGSVFGSSLSNGFGGGSGPKLSSFAAPGSTTTLPKAKPAKAFGAPDSDEEEDTDGDDDDDQAGSAEEEKPTSSPEEKKKSKPQKVQIEDGEAGEATLLHVRAKLFALTSTESGWKERGVGMLKINVPESSVDYDDDGHAIPGTFTKPVSDDLESAPIAPRVPRLIMRQENTHRVILNSALTKQMVFKDKPAASSAQIYFTAIEGDEEPKPVSMLLKMNENNASLFRNEVASIQDSL